MVFPFNFKKKFNTIEKKNGGITVHYLKKEKKQEKVLKARWILLRDYKILVISKYDLFCIFGMFYKHTLVLDDSM